MTIWKGAVSAGHCSGVALLVLIGFPFTAAGRPGNPAPGVSLGKSVYESKCVECHGSDGRGNGPASALLNPRPRDFTAGKYKFRSTESGSIPTDADILNTVRNGLHATAMPDWKPFVGDDSLKAVVSYVKTFSARFANETPKTVNIGATVPSSAASIAAGKKVFENSSAGAVMGVTARGRGLCRRNFRMTGGTTSGRQT
jgi:mono/diheme cytochrome c family protein